MFALVHIISLNHQPTCHNKRTKLLKLLHLKYLVLGIVQVMCRKHQIKFGNINFSFPTSCRNTLAHSFALLKSEFEEDRLKLD